jgi:hypothetical protein
MYSFWDRRSIAQVTEQCENRWIEDLMTRWIAKAQIRFHVGMKMGRQRSNFVWFTKKTKNKKQKHRGN